MASKWILINLSYTVSKLVRFLRHSVDYIDIAGRSSARICRALTFALARLSCNYLI